MQDQYVVLTGSKGNAGDFFIRYRTLQLLGWLRPDRRVVNYDAWRPFTDEQLRVINESRALILAGGPALQYQMYPGIYPLRKDLSQIKVPVIVMGIGYKDQNGSWERTSQYQLSADTVRLLEKVDSSGFLSGVRDYHTLNVLLSRGFKNFRMTGCPTLYDNDFIEKPYPERTISKVSFSLGVSYLESASMEKQMKSLIVQLRNRFIGAEYQVLFHHKLNRSIAAQAKMEDWLKKEEIRYKDISGGVEKMLEEYGTTDLHVGYRVHAHILMCSISRPSILINEDSRGKALFHVIGGLSFDAYTGLDYSISGRLMDKLGIGRDRFLTSSSLCPDLLNQLDYELAAGAPRLAMPRMGIDHHFSQMRSYIEQLP